MRAFIAISLPDSVLQEIAEAQERLRGSGLNIRWVRKEGIHLTLKFLGEIDWGDVERIHSAMDLSSKAFSPLTLRGDGIGVFPDLKRPRVVWVGVSGDVQAAQALQGDLEFRLDNIGFPKENRPFKCHLTMGRVKGRLDHDKLIAALEGLKGFQTVPFTAESVILFQSDLRPQGAIYSRLAEVRMGES